MLEKNHKYTNILFKWEKALQSSFFSDNLSLELEFLENSRFIVVAFTRAEWKKS